MKIFLRHAPARTEKYGLLRHAGFSLIELMIALAIGLMLVAGLGMILFGVRSTYLTQDGLMRMQEGERYLLTSLNNSVQMAGFFADPMRDTLLNALPENLNNPDGSSFAQGQGIAGTTSGGGASDTLNTRYQSASGDDAMNCLGGTNTSGASVVWINSFAIDAGKHLVCTATTIDATGARTVNAAILVDDVVRMTVLYGVGTSADGQTSRYLGSAEVTAANAWPDVVSVKVTLIQTDLVNGKPGAPNRPPLVHVINLMNNSGKRTKAT